MDDHSKSVDLVTLACIECGRAWDQPDDRWRAKVTDDEPPELVLYCEACAEREFGT